MTTFTEALTQNLKVYSRRLNLDPVDTKEEIDQAIELCLSHKLDAGSKETGMMLTLLKASKKEMSDYSLDERFKISRIAASVLTQVLHVREPLHFGRMITDMAMALEGMLYMNGLDSTSPELIQHFHINMITLIRNRDK